jgi:ATP-binding cassette subfamily B protein
MNADGGPSEPERRHGARTLLRCYSYLRPYWPRCLVGLAGMLAADALNLLAPQLIRTIVDRGIGGRDLRLAGLLAAALVGLALVRGAFTFIQGRLIEQASQGVAYDLRNELQARLAALSFAFHDSAETGQLLSRAVQDVDRVRFLTGRASFRLLDSVVFSLATLATLLVMNVRLALAAMGMLPLLVLVALRFGSRQRHLSRDIQDVRGPHLAHRAGTARCPHRPRLRAGGRRARALRKAERPLAPAVRPARAERGGRSPAAAPRREPRGRLHGVVRRAPRDVRRPLARSPRRLLRLPRPARGPVRLVGMIAPAIAMAVSSGERVFEILDARSEVTEAPDAAPLAVPRGRVEFENVSFSYFNRFPVLREVSFTAEPGEVIALLGATGSGKSTVANLVPRFYDATAGRVLVDGRDVKSLTLASLRGAIGIVLQETTLFASTVRENILFGVDGAGEDEMVRAARRAQAHDFIAAMSDGYETRIGERGVTLSGGQKQRIAIARALVKDPRILILDDATSSVDAVTEHEIQAALDELMRGRTTFVIAHRLSTIRRADQILVLDGGRIVARGTHEDLLGMSPRYAEMFARQALGGEAAPGGSP